MQQELNKLSLLAFLSGIACSDHFSLHAIDQLMKPDKQFASVPD
jgi:hypothetical protein